MNRSRDKGTRAATAVARYLAETFPQVERRSLHGAADRGDITGLPGIVIEVKAAQRLNVPDWLAQLRREMNADHAALGLVWCKLAGTMDPARWAAILPPEVATCCQYQHGVQVHCSPLPPGFQRAHMARYVDQLPTDTAAPRLDGYSMRIRGLTDDQQPVLTSGVQARHLLAHLTTSAPVDVA